MNKTDILNSIKIYSDKNPKLTFYNDCYNYINNLPDSITSIEINEHLLESIRITILSNPGKYHLYISTNEIKNKLNYKMILSNNQKNNLLQQLECIMEYNDIMSLNNIKNKFNNMKFKSNDDKYNVYIVISNNDIDEIKNEIYKLNDNYNILGYIFGIDILNLLEHQRLDRIINFIKDKNCESYKTFNMINNYKKYLDSMNWESRDRIMIFSGVLFSALGLTYTRDIDLLVLAENKSRNDVNNIMNKLINTDKYEIEPHILVNDNNWYKQCNNKIISYKYQQQWLTYTMPYLSGSTDIYDTMCNPKFNFIFMGMKFISIDMNIKRFISRVNPNSFADLIMLEKINNYKIGDYLCIPNMTIRQGKLNIFDDKTIQFLNQTIKRKIKEFYDYDISINDVESLLQKCNVKSFDIYKGKNTYDPDTSLIKKFHLDIKDQIYNEYCKNVEYLLDIGSGQLTDARYWNKVNVKNVIGIEPSIVSIRNGMERLQKFGTKTNINIINGIGDIDWKSDKKYSDILKHKFDIITFQFTLHYMIPNIDIIIKNIKYISKKNTKIIITCMDGNKIYNDLITNKKIEVRNYQEPIFAIVPLNDLQNNKLINNINVLVYFKGAYGVANGSIEPLIDINNLIKTFDDNNFKLIKKTNFLEYKSHNKDKMNDIQKKVSSYYMSIIFNIE